MKPFSRRRRLRHQLPTSAKNEERVESNRDPNKTREIFLAAGMAVVGTVVGSLVTAGIHQHSEVKRRQAESLIASFQSDFASNTPQEFFDVKMMVDQMRNATLLGDDVIGRLVSLDRKYPGCQLAPKSFSNACRPYLIETTIALRVASGGSEVSFEDMNLLLGPRIDNAKRAYERIIGAQIRD